MTHCKSNRKPAAFLLLGILSVLAVYGLLFHDAITNDVRLWQITRQLKTLPQPPDTTLVSSNAAVGLLQGNGNHCDYFAGAIYRSQSSAEAIQKHYEGREFQNPVTGNPDDWEITILKSHDSFSTIALPDDFDHPDAWGLTSTSYSTGNLFLVHVNRTYEANGDWRCH